MFLVELFIIGAVLVLVSTLLICLLLGLFIEDTYQAMLLMISIFLVNILLESSLFLSSSSAALPACLDGFIVETNGSTGGAYTCTPLIL